MILGPYGPFTFYVLNLTPIGVDKRLSADILARRRTLGVGWPVIARTG
jgi:hypothetical protein